MMPREVVLPAGFGVAVAAAVVLFALAPARKLPLRPAHVAGVHNLQTVGPGLLSGSSPEGEAGFATLRRLGVRTIVSVDGTAPDVSLAARYGLRYVHVPVGYDGVPRNSALRIARAVRDLPGPAYVHCHHGKHRGPAAAVAARLCLDASYTPADAEALLHAAGTDPRYRGLVSLPRTLVRPSVGELDRVSADFPASAPVPDFVRRMVDIDDRFDRLKAAQKAGWPDPRSSADDAVQLTEHYREAARLPAVERHGPAFAELLRAAEATALELGDTLRRDPAAAGPAWVRAGRQCASCHARWRDG